MSKTRKINIPLLTKDGGRTVYPVDGFKFSAYVDNVRFWFACHQTPGSAFHYTLAHYATGTRITDVPSITIQACLGDVKGAAKLTLEKFVTSREKGRVYDVLQRAEQNPDKYPVINTR